MASLVCRTAINPSAATVIGIFVSIVIKYPVVTVVVAGKVESRSILFAVIRFTPVPDF